jgi:hypothetical protein
MSSYFSPGKSLPVPCASLALRTASISDSVHCLFLISSEFILVSPARADDADCLFAIVILLGSVNHKQDCPGSGANGYGSQSMPALLSCFIDAVKLYQAAGILEYQSRELE